MAGRLAGKIAIVTGAGRGIGEAIARCFAGEGAAVTIAEKDPETGAATARSIVENGGRAHFVATDVTKAEDVERAVAETVARFGPPTTLVNNAGTNVFHEPLA
ncbi:MAG TPA: SDR family NAD(P)-dependent oxidoreductase, partial [Dongiaceae bacterium]